MHPARRSIDLVDHDRWYDVGPVARMGVNVRKGWPSDTARTSGATIGCQRGGAPGFAKTSERTHQPNFSCCQK